MNLIQFEEAARHQDFSCFHSLKIVYCLRRVNVSLNTLSRAMCTTTPVDSPFKLHESLCHLRVTRLSHFQQTMNLLYSILRISKVTSRHPLCWECKPCYHHLEKAAPLVKAILPFSRSNIDFKGFFSCGWGERGGVGSCPAIWHFCASVGFTCAFVDCVL